MAKPTQKAGAKPAIHVNKAPNAKELRAVEKEASERFTRLGLITEILRGEGRERYDHFLDNGFPKWRGTGYYYARFRPGLGSTLVGLFVFVGGLTHYVVLILGYKRQKDFVERYIAQARKAAWGDDRPGLANIPGLGDIGAASTSTTRANDADSSDDEPSVEPVNRRERRAQEKEAKKKKAKDKTLKPSAANKQRTSGTSTPLEIAESGTSTPVPGPKKRVEAENGKMLIVDKDGNVFLEEEDEETEETELFLLDPAEIVKPTFKQTWLYRLPAWLVELAKEKLPLKKKDDESTVQTEDVGETVIVSTAAAANGEAKTSSGDVADGKTPSGARQRKKRGKIR